MDPKRWYTGYEVILLQISEFLPVWDKLSPTQQNMLTAGATLRQVKKGTVLHNGSLDCTGLMLVCQGQLRAYILSDEGREITVYRLFPRDLCLFSASCIMRSIQFEIAVAAEKDTQFWLIPPKLYKSVMEVSAPLANFTGEVMATRFSEVMWLMEQILWKSLDKRLAAFLAEEASIEDSLTLKINHETIGNHLGSPREVITRMLKYFQAEGMVALSRGAVEILSRQKLEALADL